MENIVAGRSSVGSTERPPSRSIERPSSRNSDRSTGSSRWGEKLGNMGEQLVGYVLAITSGRSCSTAQANDSSTLRYWTLFQLKAPQHTSPQQNQSDRNQPWQNQYQLSDSNQTSAVKQIGISHNTIGLNKLLVLTPEATMVAYLLGSSYLLSQRFNACFVPQLW